MAQFRYEGFLINGQIKFSRMISLDEVKSFALEVKQGDEGTKFKFMVVRSCCTNQFGIAFTYEYDGMKKSSEEIMYKMTDKLLRRFGREVNWDITNGFWAIE